MVRSGNGSLYDRFIFVDFDNAAFGFRAWDILYYLTKWPVVIRFVLSYQCKKRRLRPSVGPRSLGVPSWDRPIFDHVLFFCFLEPTQMSRGFKEILPFLLLVRWKRRIG